MTPVLATAPAGSHADPCARPRGTPAGGGLTLEQRLGRALEGARAQGHAECPLCHGRMTPAPEGAACRDCGSLIS